MKYTTKISVELTPLEIKYIVEALARVEFKDIEIQDCYKGISENLCDDFANILHDFNVPIGFPKE